MSTWTGSLPLARSGARRDRVLVAVWALVLVGVCYASAAATPSLYPTQADRVAASRAIDASPAIVALYGPILDVHSRGELAMTKMTVLYAVFVAALVAVVVRRHTRTEEEAGRAELVGGTAVGRNAALAAAVAEGVVISLVVGALAAAADVAGGLPAVGSVAFGASWAGIGVVTAGLTALACQLSASARTCGAAVAVLLGALFVLRAVGDASAGWMRRLGWLSPFGWSTRLSAWSDPRWWVLGLYAGSGVVLVAVAGALRSRRDLGSGLLAARPGPARGRPRLADALALAVRQQAATLVTWSTATLVLGTLLGAVVPNVSGLLGSSTARELVARLGGFGAIQEALVAAELSIVAVLVTCYAVGVVARGGSDERDGRTEQVLATATSRARAYGATVVVALSGAAWLLVVAGVAVALGYGRGLGRIVGAALGQGPAVLLVTALALGAYAVRGRLASAGWWLVGLFVSLGQLGEALRLPAWVVGLSPYAHAPRMPVEAFRAGPALVMTALALVALVGGWAAYRERDIG